METFAMHKNQYNLPVGRSVNNGNTYNGNFEVNYTSRWREALKRVFDEGYTAHFLQCVKINHKDQGGLKYLQAERIFKYNLKCRVLFDIADTIEKELSGDMKLLPLIFENEYWQEDQNTYLKMVHRYQQGGEYNLYKKARFKYIVQTMMDQSDVMGIEGYTGNTDGEKPYAGEIN